MDLKLIQRNIFGEFFSIEKHCNLKHQFLFQINLENQFFLLGKLGEKRGKSRVGWVLIEKNS